MKRAYFVCLFLALTTSVLSQSNPISRTHPTARVASPTVASAISASQADPKDQARILDGYGKLPLSFEANQGQTDARVKFLSRTGGYTLFLTGDEAVLEWSGSAAKKPAPKGAPGSGGDTASLTRFPDTKPNPAAVPRATGGVLRMKLLNANPKTEMSGQDELRGKSNYFIGNDPEKWHTNVRQFSKVRYENVYPGVDLVYYGHQRELEYDFVLQPGASPQSIRLGIAGAKRLRLEHGDLVLASAGGDVHLRSPHIYQEAYGVRREVHGRYLIKSKNEVGFDVAAYDRRRALVIDPVLAYSTYLGGSDIDTPFCIAVDSSGNSYVTGLTRSTSFPTVNPVQASYGGDIDAFVTKFNADGTALVYSTYLGGSYEDYGTGIAVDSAGNAYVTGETQSTDFPTVNPIQPTQAGHGDAFVTKINAAGSALVYSTYLGGSGADIALAIAVGSAGNAYMTGWTDSADFPTVNAIQPKNAGGDTDAFVTKINAAGSALVYSTYLGGTSQDEGRGAAVDSAGNAYVTGQTISADFPTANAIQPTHGGGVTDAFVTKINAAGSAFVYSTYLGGTSTDEGYGVAVDSAGNAYVTGGTCSADFPTANAFQPHHGYCSAFVTKLNSLGSALVYSTYLGGSQSDRGYAIATDSAGNAYVTGYADSTDFPMANAIQPAYGGGTADAFVTKINAAGSALVYSTYLGGKAQEYGYSIATDKAGSAYITGVTRSKNFPKTVVAFQRSLDSTQDTFVTKIAAETFLGISPLKLTFGTRPIGTTSVPKQVSLTNNGASAITIHKIYFTGINAVDFAETDNCGGSLASGGTCDIWVSSTPDWGKNQALMVISDSDPASPQTVAVLGSGTIILFSPTKLSFGKQAVGTISPPQTVTLTNLSNNEQSFPIGIDGVNSGDFSQTNNCYGVAAGASCTITVTFTPTATGTRSASVTTYDPMFFYWRKVVLAGTGM